MNDLEQQLRAALERQEPSPDFARKVMARANGIERRRRSFSKAWMSGCVAASLLAGSFGIAEYQKQRERERGQMAHTQLIRALGITSSKLQRIQRKLDGLHHE